MRSALFRPRYRPRPPMRLGLRGRCVAVPVALILSFSVLATSAQAASSQQQIEDESRPQATSAAAASPAAGQQPRIDPAVDLAAFMDKVTENVAVMNRRVDDPAVPGGDRATTTHRMVFHQPFEGVWLPRTMMFFMESPAHETRPQTARIRLTADYYDYRQTAVDAQVVFGRPNVEAILRNRRPARKRPDGTVDLTQRWS